MEIDSGRYIMACAFSYSHKSAGLSDLTIFLFPTNCPNRDTDQFILEIVNCISRSSLGMVFGVINRYNSQEVVCDLSYPPFFFHVQDRTVSDLIFYFTKPLAVTYF